MGIQINAGFFQGYARACPKLFKIIFQRPEAWRCFFEYGMDMHPKEQSTDSVLSSGCFLQLPGMPTVLKNNGLKEFKTELKDELDFVVSR